MNDEIVKNSALNVLDKENILIHIYRLKTFRGLTVVLKITESGVSSEDIRSTLTEKVFDVASVTNMMN